jgi:hypothetical protein
LTLPAQAASTAACSPPSAGYLDANTNRDERSTEWFARDALQWGEIWQLWAGLRHTRMDRRSERTSADGEGSLRATDYDRSATTPWLALAAQVTAQDHALRQLGPRPGDRRGAQPRALHQRRPEHWRCKAARWKWA